MRGPRIDFYNDMESEATESKSYDQGLYEIIFHLRQIARDQRAAGYEQALRDLWGHIGSMTIHDEVGGSESTDKMLSDFAAERGIDLGQTRATRTSEAVSEG